MAYRYVRVLTIDHTKVPNTDQTNFPVRIVGTLASLATVANGGRLTNASGFDLNLYSDAGLTTAIAYERVVYDPVTGNHEFFVVVPSVSHTVDTPIYLAYSDSGVTTDQSNKTGVWDSNFVAVYQLGTGASFDGTDSTSNANNLTNSGLSAAADDQVGGAALDAAAGTNKATKATPAGGASGSGPFQIEALFYPDENTTTGVVFCFDSSASGSGSVFEMVKRPTGVIRGSFGSGSGVGQNCDSTALYNAAAWNYAVAKYTDTTNRSVMVNGAAPTTQAAAVTPVNAPDQYGLMARFVGGSTFSNFFIGKVGHVRVSKTARSDDWNAATTASVLNPSTFYSVGAETDLSATFVASGAVRNAALAVAMMCAMPVSMSQAPVHIAPLVASVDNPQPQPPLGTVNGAIIRAYWPDPLSGAVQPTGRVIALLPPPVVNNPPIQGALRVGDITTIRATWPDPIAGAVQRFVGIAPLTLVYGQQPPVTAGLTVAEMAVLVRSQWPDPVAGAVQRFVKIAPLTLVYGQQPPITAGITVAEMATIRASWPEQLVAPSVQRIARSAAWDPGSGAVAAQVPFQRVPTPTWSPEGVRLQRTQIAAQISAAQFVQRTVHINASTYYGTDAGDFTYQAFIPSQAAIAAQGWSGLPYRVMLAMHGSAEQGSDGTSQMLGGGSIAQKLGWSTSPDQTWPTIVVFPQTPAGWTGPGGADAGARARRMALQLITATLNATLNEFNCDPRRCFITGLSYGAQVAIDYCYQYPNVFAALIPAAGDMDHTVSEDTPGLPTFTTETQAAAEIGPWVRNIPTRTFNSVGDLTITTAKYQPMIDEYTALAPNRDVVNTVYGSGDHSTVWTTAYADAGNTLWPWMFAQQLPAFDPPPGRTLAAPAAALAPALDVVRPTARPSVATIAVSTPPIPVGGLTASETATIVGAWPDPRALDRLPTLVKVAPLTLPTGDQPPPRAGLNAALVQAAWRVDTAPQSLRPTQVVSVDVPPPRAPALSPGAQGPAFFTLPPRAPQSAAWDAPVVATSQPAPLAPWLAAVVGAWRADLPPLVRVPVAAIALPTGDQPTPVAAVSANELVAIAAWSIDRPLPQAPSKSAAWLPSFVASRSGAQPHILGAWAVASARPATRASVAALIPPPVVDNPPLVRPMVPRGVDAAWRDVPEPRQPLLRAAVSSIPPAVVNNPPLNGGRALLAQVVANYWAASAYLATPSLYKRGAREPRGLGGFAPWTAEQLDDRLNHNASGAETVKVLRDLIATLNWLGELP